MAHSYRIYTSSLQASLSGASKQKNSSYRSGWAEPRHPVSEHTSGANTGAAGGENTAEQEGHQGGKKRHEEQAVDFWTQVKERLRLEGWQTEVLLASKMTWCQIKFELCSLWGFPRQTKLETWLKVPENKASWLGGDYFCETVSCTDRYESDSENFTNLSGKESGRGTEGTFLPKVSLGRLHIPLVQLLTASLKFPNRTKQGQGQEMSRAEWCDRKNMSGACNSLPPYLQQLWRACYNIFLLGLYKAPFKMTLVVLNVKSHAKD